MFSHNIFIYNFHNLNLRDKSLKENNLVAKEKEEFQFIIFKILNALFQVCFFVFFVIFFASSF